MQICDIDEWVNDVQEASVIELRQAIHTVIIAISSSKYLNDRMVVKGGVLLALRYKSTRFTKDIDFSTSELYTSFDKDNFLLELTSNLAIAVESLPYGLDCRIQSEEICPKSGGTFPTLRIRIGYASKGTPRHKKLIAGTCPDVLQIDYSFNEESTVIDYLEIDENTCIKMYCLADLVGEKYRALLQQEIRNRIRRQDAYDIYWLIKTGYLSTIDKADILAALRLKTSTRNMIIDEISILSPGLKERSKKEYETLAQEIEGELPQFEEVYSIISDYYCSLPW